MKTCKCCRHLEAQVEERERQVVETKQAALAEADAAAMAVMQVSPSLSVLASATAAQQHSSFPLAAVVALPNTAECRQLCVESWHGRSHV